MKAIGFRVEPKKITYAVIDEDEIILDKIIPTISLEMPDRLKNVRTHILSTIKELDIQCAGVRMMETNAQTINIDRCYIEGVVLEAIASSDIHYYGGNIVKMAPLFSIKSSELKEVIKAENTVEDLDIGLDIWKRYNQIERECIIVALASAKDAT